MVQRAAPFCGSRHHRAAQQGVPGVAGRGAQRRCRTRADGDYDPERLPIKGLRPSHGSIRAGAYSQAFYWEETWRELGYTSFDDFLYGFWEGFFRDGRDPNNLIAMIGTWHSGNVGNTPGFDGDAKLALASIKCPLLAMPAEKDLYFPPEDEQWASSVHPARRGQGDPRHLGSLRRRRRQCRRHATSSTPVCANSWAARPATRRGETLRRSGAPPVRV